MEGQSPCGRTNMLIKGGMGRADQTAKIKGMFVRPEQVADLVTRVDGAVRARVIVDRAGDADTMRVQIEGDGIDAAAANAAITDTLKLNGEVDCVGTGQIPRDGVVIEDRRTYET